MIFPQSFTVPGMDEGDATEHLEGAGPGWGFIFAPQDLWVLLGRRRRKNVKNRNFSLSFSHNPVYKHVTGNGCQHIQTVKHLLKYLHGYGFSFPQNPNLEESPRLFLTNDKHAVFPHPAHFWNGRNSQIRLTVWRYDEKEGLSSTVRLLLTR